MAYEGFAGGLASGFSNMFNSQQKNILAQRAQEQQQQLQLSGQVHDALNNLYSTAATIAKSAADAGQPVPASSIKALADQAAELSQNAAKHGILSPDIAATVGPRIQALAGLTPSSGPDASFSGHVVTNPSNPYEQNLMVLNRRTGEAKINPMPGSNPAAPAPTAPVPAVPGRQSMNLSDQNITGVQVTGDNIPSPNQRVAAGFEDATPKPASFVQPVSDTTPASPLKDAEDTINYTHLVPLPEGLGKLTPRALRSMAIQVSLGNSSVLTRQPAIVRQAVQSDAADINMALRRSGADVNMSAADYKANTSALTQLAKQTAAIGTFERTAIKNGDILVQLANKVDQTGVPVVEKWLRQGKQALGDPDVAEFAFQMNLFRSEVAKIVQNPNLTGILTDEARKEVEQGLPNASNAKQIAQIVARAKSDFQNRRDAVAEEMAAVKSRFGFPKPISQPTAPTVTAPAIAPQPTQPAHRIVTPGGSKFMIEGQ